ncbi:putative disease resistance protein RGA3 [Nicotiana tabacum]|uniref:Disease resistance protein RGA3 n=1 Tax=Nicotiana tabacum TaxID=4097 RepID=A0AC58RQ43_TOBAC
MELPFGLANITGLRHLNIAGRDGLTRLPAGLGNLAQLQTSSLYTVGKGIGESITEISCLNLRGELRIRCLENIRDKEEAILANLRAKKYVELLRFQWGSGNEEKIVKLATARDKCPNLITAPTFQSLLYLELRDWHPKILESVENMSSLSHLVIDALQEIKHLMDLKPLTISYCEKLTHLPAGIRKLKALEYFDINGCHCLESLPTEEIAGFSSPLRIAAT